MQDRSSERTSLEDAPRLARDAAARMSAAIISQDPADYRAAADLVAAALAADPSNYDAVRVNAWVLAGEHRFEDAAEWARRAAAMNPADPSNYGVLADALVELGDYDGAVEAAQTMIDLRPAQPSYARAAYLRSLHGDRDGAIELMRLAVASSADAPSRAWCLVHLGAEHLLAGDADAAAQACRDALSLVPDLRIARLGLARAEEARGDAASAEEILRSLVTAETGDADAHAALGELLAATGRGAEAASHLDRAEALERAELAAGGAEGHHLVSLLLLRGGPPGEALRRAESEAAQRRDVFTWDRLAMARLAAGRIDAAREASALALRTGADDPTLLAHAGLVAAAAGDAAVARDLLTRALRRAAALVPSDRERAREALRRLAP